MRTGKTVDADGPKSSKVGKLPAQLLGDMHLKVRELVDRIERGSLDFQWAMNQLQWVIEGQKRVLAKKWKEVDGVFYLTVTSDGTSGEGWIKRFEGKRRPICLESKFILRGSDFQPTNGKETQIAIVPARLFSWFGVIDEGDCTRDHFREYARRRSFTDASLETTCLVRDQLSDTDMNEDMDLYWINPLLLCKRNEEKDLGFLQITAPSNPADPEICRMTVREVHGRENLNFSGAHAAMFEVPFK